MNTLRFFTPLLSVALLLGACLVTEDEPPPTPPANVKPPPVEDPVEDPPDPPTETPDADGGAPGICDKISPWCRYADPWDPNYVATYVWPFPGDTTAIAKYGQPKCYCMCQYAPDPKAFCTQKVDANGVPSPTGTPVAAECGTLLTTDMTGKVVPFFPGDGHPPVCQKTQFTVP